MTANLGMSCDIARDRGMIESPDGNPDLYTRCISIGLRSVLFFPTKVEKMATKN